MFEVNIQVDDLVNLELFPTKKLQAKLQSTLNRVGRDGKNFWKSEAGRRLKSSREAYQAAIEWGADMQVGVTLGLTGGSKSENFLANAVEFGYPAFDMKPGLLKSKALVRVPLNVDRRVVFSNPKVFRTITNKSPVDSWIHPGWQGMNIVDDVVDELNDNIIPQRIGELMEKL